MPGKTFFIAAKNNGLWGLFPEGRCHYSSDDLKSSDEFFN
jgi:hypothetical protein